MAAKQQPAEDARLFVLIADFVSDRCYRAGEKFRADSWQCQLWPQLFATGEDDAAISAASLRFRSEVDASAEARRQRWERDNNPPPTPTVRAMRAVRSFVFRGDSGPVEVTEGEVHGLRDEVVLKTSVDEWEPITE